jgi:predicted O-linked N-acetylglucosamine transferase (SPINDLY family)
MVFARRAAPVQVAFPGYPGTTGLEVIDGFVTDIHQDPAGNEQFYTEKLIRFAGSPRCYRAPVDGPATGPLPMDIAGVTTFGIVQRPGKLSERMFALWSQFLLAVPKSKLVMLLGRQRPGELARHFKPIFEHHRINPARVELVPRQKRSAYFHLFQRIDLVLDTLPYNGCVTTLDALWMGVPVVTLAGKTYVSRVGKSILAQIGLSELSVESDQAYIEVATQLATDAPRLRALRQTLRARMQESPLLDARRVTTELEETCRKLWREWCTPQQSPIIAT